MSFKFGVLKLETSKYCNFVHSANISSMYKTFDVSKCETSIELTESQYSNIFVMSFTSFVLN